MDAKFYRKEYDTLVSESQQARLEWQRLAEFLMPQHANIQLMGFGPSSIVEGRRKTKQIFDTTGIDALDKLVSLIIGTATSPVMKWFTGRHEDPDINLDYDAQYWMDDVTTRMYNAINNSNFSTVGAETFRDIVGFGTGNIATHEKELPFSQKKYGFRGLYFTGVPIGTYVVQENALGEIDMQSREFRVPAGRLKQRWPDGEYGRNTLKLIDEKPWEKVRVLHCVRPLGRKWESTYMIITTGTDSHEEVLNVGQFFEFPNHITRWDKATGEVYGFGRGHLAIPEVATLNRARQLKLRQWALSVHPPLMALDDGVIGKPRIIPGAINRIRMQGALEPFQTGANFQHEAIPENESKLQIRQIFYTEQILQFAPAAKTPPTATEVLQRMEFLHQLLGPSLGRIQNEFLTPLLNRVFNIMYRAGAFPPPPPILAGRGGIIHFDFEGPLARAQRSDELRAVGDTMAVVSNLAAVDPTVWDNYDLDTMSRDAGRITGISRRYLRSVEAAAQIREARKQAQAQQQMLANLEQGSAAAKNFGQAQAAMASAGTGTAQTTDMG